MVRLPAGFHRDAGAGMRGSIRPQRYDAIRQHHYWRQTVTALHAGATASIPPGQPTIPDSKIALLPAQAAAGPQGAGERWAVDLVQVQLGPQLGQAPLIVQQIAAQTSGTTTQPPPPVVAQAWLQIGGLNTYLLAQTSQGGNDAMSVSCPLLTPGEQIAVVWYGWPGGSGFPWMTLRGTRYALSVT